MDERNGRSDQGGAEGTAAGSEPDYPQEDEVTNSTDEETNGPAKEAPDAKTRSPMTAGAAPESPSTLYGHVDAYVEKACVDMRNVYANNREALGSRRREAQEASDDLRVFKEDRGLRRHARVTGGRDHWIMLGAITGFATLVVSALFADEIDGWLFARLPEALLVTGLNVGAVGLLGRVVIGMVVQNRPWIRFLGWLSFILGVVPLATSINLGAAHYRDALRESWPGLIRENSEYVDPADVSENPDDIYFHPCQTSNTQRSEIVNDPDVEAWCLVGEELFDLHTLKSYLLFLVGLLSASLAMLVWAFVFADPHPGYSRVQERWRAIEGSLRAREAEALRQVAVIHGGAIEFATDRHRALLTASAGGSDAAVIRINACRLEVESDIRRAAKIR